MKRLVTDCDGCGATNISDDGHIEACIGRKMDEAGDMEGEFLQLDLCQACLRRAVVELVRSKGRVNLRDAWSEFELMVKRWKA